MSAHDAQHTDRENARALPSVSNRSDPVKSSSKSAQALAREAGSPAEAQNTGRGGRSVDGGRRKGNPTVI